jgi:hypothetical protein
MQVGWCKAAAECPVDLRNAKRQRGVLEPQIGPLPFEIRHRLFETAKRGWLSSGCGSIVHGLF